MIIDFIETQMVEILNTYEERLAYLSEVVEHGCQDRVLEIGEVDEATAFFSTYKKEINRMMSAMANSTEYLIIEGWDHNDPLVLHSRNQTLLAWWAYEIVANSLLEVMKGVQ